MFIVHQQGVEFFQRVIQVSGDILGQLKGSNLRQQTEKYLSTLVMV